MANAKLSSPTHEYAVVDTNPGSAGFYTNEVNIREKMSKYSSKVFFSIRDTAEDISEAPSALSSITVKVCETGTKTASSWWYNNTIYNCPKVWDNDGEHMIIRNNIFHTVTGVAAFDLGNGGATRSSDYNCFYNVPYRVLPLGKHDTVVDPSFVSPTIGNFALQTNSPCRRTGLYIAGYTKTKPDMGSNLSEMESAG